MTSTTLMVRYVWPPVLITVILGVLAGFSVLTQEAWVAPSLASAVFSQLPHPDDSGSHPINIALGQVIGVGAGMAGVVLAGQMHAPRLMGGHDLMAGRALAIALAALLASFTQALSGKKTPAGGAHRRDRNRDGHLNGRRAVSGRYRPPHGTRGNGASMARGEAEGHGLERLSPTLSRRSSPADCSAV